MSTEALLKSPMGSLGIVASSEARGIPRKSGSQQGFLPHSFPNSLPANSLPPNSMPRNSCQAGSLPPSSLPRSLASSWKSRPSQSDSQQSSLSRNSSLNSPHSSQITSRSFMSSLDAPDSIPTPLLPVSYSFFSKPRIVASSSYNRWLVALSALSIHLSIGQTYAFSVFNNPLSMLLGLTQPDPHDWARTEIFWIFSGAIMVLGLSGFVFGSWIDRVGPRLAMFVSALCFGGGFAVSGLGIHFHDIWTVYLGYGLLGGIGLGIGYISPMSALIRWFPDRPGMAAGVAIMGFGGGAALASPLSVGLMEFFRTPTDLGVRNTFFTLGALYFCVMMIGMLTIRLPPEGWERVHSDSIPAGANVDADVALRTPQFWLMWVVLALNVTGGIGILAEASPMVQEIFPDKVDAKFAALFVVLLSLSNTIGRFVWSSLSDLIGRRYIYTVFFSIGAVLYAIAPLSGDFDEPWLFVGIALVIVSMYGGGFATLPAYIRDQFGIMHIAPIHGRLLTAWSVAGVAGPALVTYLRQNQLDEGVPKSKAYQLTMYILAAMLGVGFIANLCIRPVKVQYHFAKHGGT